MSMIGKRVVSKGNKHSTVSSAHKVPHPSHHKSPHKGSITGKDSAKVTYHGKKSGIGR
jgi:hypothetical protein